MSGRPAFTIVETIAALSVLAIIFASLIPLLAGFHEIRRELDAVGLATNEVQNKLEHITAAHQRNEFDPTTLASLAIDEDLKPYLGETKWESQVDEVATPPGQRLTLTLHYGKANRRSASLTAWLWEDSE